MEERCTDAQLFGREFQTKGLTTSFSLGIKSLEYKAAFSFYKPISHSLLLLNLVPILH